MRGQQLPLLVHRRERPSREPLPARAGGRSIHSGTARHQADLHDAQESLQARGLSRLFITVSSPGSCGWAGLQRRPSLQLNSQAPRKPWVPASASPFRDDILSARRACSSIRACLVLRAKSARGSPPERSYGGSFGTGGTAQGAVERGGRAAARVLRASISSWSR